jgi:hypothetical protein
MLKIRPATFCLSLSLFPKGNEEEERDFTDKSRSTTNVTTPSYVTHPSLSGTWTYLKHYWPFFFKTYKDVNINNQCSSSASMRQYPYRQTNITYR